jgi:hypothetical protein
MRTGRARTAAGLLRRYPSARGARGRRRSRDRRPAAGANRALQRGQHAVQPGAAGQPRPVRHAVPVGRRPATGEVGRQLPLRRGQDVDRERAVDPDGRQRMAGPVEADQQQRRVEGQGADRIGGDAGRPSGPTEVITVTPVANWPIARRNSAGVTSVVVVTHEIGFAREVADTIAFLDGGRIVESGPPPARLADLLQEWHEAGLSGFRLRPGAIPGDLEAITRELVPELQRRGAFRTSCPAPSPRTTASRSPTSSPCWPAPTGPRTAPRSTWSRRARRHPGVDPGQQRRPERPGGRRQRPAVRRQLPRQPGDRAGGGGRVPGGGRSSAVPTWPSPPTSW